MEFGFINAFFLFLIIPLLVFIYYRYNSNKKESILKFSTLKIIKQTNAKNNAFRKISMDKETKVMFSNHSKIIVFNLP